MLLRVAALQRAGIGTMGQRSPMLYDSVVFHHFNVKLKSYVISVLIDKGNRWYKPEAD